MKIMVNGEERELSAVDKNGIDWTNDLLGNYDALHYDRDNDEYTMSEDEFDWWEPVVDELNQIEELEDELFESMDEETRYDYDNIGPYTDLDQETSAKLEFLKNYKDGVDDEEEDEKVLTLSYRHGAEGEEIEIGEEYYFGQLWDGEDGDGEELLESRCVSPDNENVVKFEIVEEDDDILETLVRVIDIY